MNKPIYTWDEQEKIATATIIDEAGRKFVGIARCHPDDMDFANQYTGFNIAIARATILYLKSVKRDILKPELAALKQLYYSMKQSKQFNPKSYENKMLWRQIKMKESDIVFIEQDIFEREENLKTVLKGKELLYQKLRQRR